MKKRLPHYTNMRRRQVKKLETGILHRAADKEQDRSRWAGV